ncbi:unnamed protein product [Effrenium voratum]|uniref:Uncharacterized protein n=1 Tax=Effrenium voratum TaxID=2562239 RepID=A0AA36IY44_9DINO|nr:unnamed protein product [Effrenium voratum]CAJ1415230.1 unnamed protein product [Effrenium voratum]|mmetsp:Transcript_114742/g.272934  ORF Transcript_114742/g.272934 Transcript_114742/m.272934 type:complete len:152 (-) Transcript_114742:162-617(-)|eukprot:CAMPEP_0181465064 /NCGR_PEP_ID=MMETSP1110-20121109/35759_1 /TAXON_ID=174948 /ORGANISM="Symbiodinium sp., Strain CCMP421" /LENGTH=151 /DNA_ID=CAMNT_0023589825 /DNA_START=61 /DNA_END=516 /DNA_ORIENTATION=+
MSLLAATLRRVPNARRAAPALVSRRCLGDSVTGPGPTDPANLKIAVSFFTKPAMSYGEFKQQCISLRLFAFLGTCGFCVLGLMVNPPKSSYWQQYSPLYVMGSIKDCFLGSAPPLFLPAKVERAVDVPFVCQELITTRRLLTGGSDSEDDH